LNNAHRRLLLNTRVDNKKTSNGVHTRDNGQYNTLFCVRLQSLCRTLLNVYDKITTVYINTRVHTHTNIAVMGNGVYYIPARLVKILSTAFRVLNKYEQTHYGIY